MIDFLPLRLAVPGDAHEIAALSREAIESGLAWSWTPRRVREVKLAQPDLGPGWSYLPATARVLRECAGSALSGRTSP